MRHTILLISKDTGQSQFRALILANAGYAAITASTITSATGLAARCDLAIIDKTFESEEHQDFVFRTHYERPDLVVLSLQTSLIMPDVLIMAVKDCLEADPGGPKLVVIDDPETLCQEEG